MKKAIALCVGLSLANTFFSHAQTSALEAINPSPYKTEQFEVAYPEGWDLYGRLKQRDYLKSYTISNLEEDAIAHMYYIKALGSTSESIVYFFSLRNDPIEGIYMEYGNNILPANSDTFKLEIKLQHFNQIKKYQRFYSKQDAKLDAKLASFLNKDDMIRYINQTLGIKGYAILKIDKEDGQKDLLLIYEKANVKETNKIFFRNLETNIFIFQCPESKFSKYKSSFEKIYNDFFFIDN